MTTVTECSDQERATEFKRVARRNNSLSSTRRLLVNGLGPLAAAAGWFAAGAALANPYNLPEPQTIIARETYDLHTLIMWIVVGIFVVVFGAMTWAIIRHRKSVGHQAQQFHENTTVEIVWTIIPFFILIGMAYPAIKSIIAMKDTSRPELTIKAAVDPAKQWTLDGFKAHGEKIYAGTGEAVTPAKGKSLRK